MGVIIQNFVNRSQVSYKNNFIQKCDFHLGILILYTSMYIYFKSVSIENVSLKDNTFSPGVNTCGKNQNAKVKIVLCNKFGFQTHICVIASILNYDSPKIFNIKVSLLYA